MGLDQGAIALAGGNQAGSQREDLRLRVEGARAAVNARPPYVDQDKIIDETDPELEGITARLRSQEDTTAFWNEGWSVGIVDLTSVCSLQPWVAAEQARARVADVDSDNNTSIAEVTLPRSSVAELPVQFDETRQTWIVSAPNPNLRIMGNFGGAVLRPGVFGCGFAVGVYPSFLQVARHHGRWVLRDGYHRAFGLLSRGISRAPAFFRDFGVQSLGANVGLFETGVYLGDRPPLLSDFLDDSVSADVEVPIVQKMIVIHGMELTPAV